MIRTAATHRRTRLAAAVLLGAGWVMASIPSVAAGGPVVHPAWGPRIVTDLRPSSTEIELVLDAARPVQCLTLEALAAVAEGDRHGEAVVRSADSSIVSVEDGGRVPVIAGERYAYAFVRPHRTGETTLHVGGEAVRVRVVEQDALVRSALSGRAFGSIPRVLGPSAGAGVFGEMAVAIGWWRWNGEQDRVRVRVSDGVVTKDFEASWTSSAARGPFALGACVVDFGAFAPGECTLRVVRETAAGEIEGDAVVVRVVALRSDEVVTLECEDDHGQLATNAWGPPKPPSRQADKAASGGAYFANNAAEPRLRVPIVVDEQRGAGWYQVIVHAAGDDAAGAMPSVGVTVNDAQRPSSASAIAMPTWHRIAVGTPTRLEPGRHTLRLDFVNDFAAGRADRNLKLDRVEIARVADVQAAETGSAAIGNGERAGMTGGMTGGMAGGMAGETGGAGMAMGGGMSSAGMSSGSVSGGDAWPANVGRTTLRVAFERPLDGQLLMGEAEVRGVTWWPTQRAKLDEGGEPPRVSLVVNGRVVETQRTDAPRFVLTPEGLRAGSNTLRLVAQRGGSIASTSEQTIIVPEALGAMVADAGRVRGAFRLTVHEPGWGPEVRGRLRDGQMGEQRFLAPVQAAERVWVELPERLRGVFDVHVEGYSTGRGQRLDVRVERSRQDSGTGEDGWTDAGPEAIAATSTVPNWHGTHRLTGPGHEGIRLGGGRQRLVLEVPDARGGWTASRSPRPVLWMQAIRLVERPGAIDGRGPAVNIVHPRPGTRIAGADALVAEVAGATAIVGAEAVIDGTPTGVMHEVSGQRGFGRVVVPLVLRGVKAGDRRVSLRVVDAWGNSTQTPEVSVRADPRPWHESGEEPTAYERAVLLLNRIGYGPERGELASVMALGVEGYVADRLGRSAGTGTADAAERAALELGEVRFANARSQYDVSRRAIQQAIVSGNPVRTRLVLWSQNHFSTWLRKTEAWRKLDEHEAFSATGAARFGELLRLSATSPAMLRYLDQERSFNGRLNENYAREILELHTVGVRGGYAQKDVTHLAHVLTGWTTARGALPGGGDLTADDDGLAEDFRTEPRAGSPLDQPRVVFGARFGADGLDDRHERVLRAIEMLATHPRTAEYICGKLAAHYTHADPDAELVLAMRETFLRTGGDLRRVVGTMVGHSAFWRSARTPRLAHPLDYALRLSRTTGANSPWDVGDFLAASGHGMFDRATPDGYPEVDAEVMDSNAMLQRWKLAGKADGPIADAVPGVLRWNDRALEVPMGMDTPEGSESHPTANAEAQLIVDLIAIRLTGHPLSAASNEAALRVLMRTAPVLPARPEHWMRDARIRTAGAFIAQLPEANLK